MGETDTRIVSDSRPDFLSLYERDERNDNEKYCKNNSADEKHAFKTAACVKARAEIVSTTKRPSHRRFRALEKYCADN